MENFFVICTVNSINYLTNVKAESNLSAEHKILDLGICGIHEYGVTSAQAFTKKETKLNFFTNMIQNCECISYDELAQIIETVNDTIRKKDHIEKLIISTENKLKEFTDELTKLKSEAANLNMKIEEY